MKFLYRIRSTIKRHHLIDFGDRLVIGVSGGPDSLALLLALNYLKKELGLYLHIAHLDHMMRKDSFGDSMFVAGIAKKLRIPVTLEKINVLKLAEEGSLEEIARSARFNFLFKVARKNKCNKIALGHNRDDQSETVLMRILRGTGLYGLQAISPKRTINNHIIIRPLIEIERKAIESFLKSQNITPMIDKTNLSLKFFRNRIRHELIPLLEKKYSPNIKQILSNMAVNISSDYAYLERLSKNALTRCSIKNECNTTRITIDLQKFKRFDPAIQRMVVRLAINTLKGNTRRLAFKHLQEIDDLISQRPVNSIVDLPQGISIKKKNASLLIRKH